MNNTTQKLKLEEVVSRLEDTCTIPKSSFGRGMYGQVERFIFGN